ncbi:MULTISPECIES: hypothetical protein [unclassified Streptomyces]|uniref:hypothetical protein n=1 Tax=unclassified Streptomyces TaxID=2593676 RepID=UPI002365F950|nr:MULTISPECIES: hypothetical protein [unclassified Streptomyces]WDF39452.1 hypothetical protein PBV52_22930 [Streptomyces sp. T12]
MGIRMRRTAIASSTALLLCLGAVGTANADQGVSASPASGADQAASADSNTAEDTVVGTAPPQEPEEQITEVPDGAVDDEPTYTGKPTPGDTPNRPDCGAPEFVYKPKSKNGDYHKGVGPTNSNHNGTSRTARSTFTSEVTGEVGVAIQGELETSVNRMLASIKAKFNVTVTAKLTAKLGNSIAVDTPPHKTTNAKYGVYRLKHTGVSYVIHSNCTTSPEKKVVSYSPWKVGWALWES